MKKFLTELTSQFKSVLEESHHEINRRQTVTYPYLTFDFDSEYLEENVDGFYVDVDIFDKGSSYLGIFTIEENLKAHFKGNRVLTDDLFIRFHFLRSGKVPTMDDLIIRRNLQFYCKVDWRNK